jgi:radical SAM protein with 4Fe4S-binding SPASM domain
MGFDIVHGCQLRCIGCPNSTLQDKIQFCKVENFDACLRNLDVEKIYRLRLYNYGEPLLHPELDEILEVIPRQAFKTRNIEITTNGQYWNENIFRSAFSLNIITELYVSCDGNGTSEDYERLRPPAKWEKLLVFLEGMKRLRDALCPDMFLGTRTICVDNRARKRWKKLLKAFGYEPEFRPWGTRANTVERPWGKVKTFKGVCRYLTEAKGLRIYVDYDGTVVPCCVHPRAGVLGNLTENKYSEILKSRKRKDFIRIMNKNRALIPACEECEEE